MSYMTTPAEENQPLLQQNSRNNRRKRVIILIALVIGITGIGGGLIGLPFVRLIEDAICQEYYASKPGRAEGSVSLFGVDEAHCKVDAVQSRLAYILAIQEMLDAIADLLAPTLAASLMTISPWLPFIIGISAMTFAMLLTILIPETYHTRTQTAFLASEASHEVQPKDSGILQQFGQITAMFKSRSLCLIFISFVGEQLILKNSAFAMRYVSKRFSWPLSRFGYFMSVRALVGILVYLLILPRLSSFIQHKFALTSLCRDLTLARMTGTVLVAGLFLAAGPTLGCVLAGLLLVTIGSSSTTICRSIAAHFVDERHVASMYTFLNLLNTAGAILASPLLASTFVLGMKWGRDWQGLPYLCLGFLGTISTTALFLIRQSTSRTEEAATGEH
ncbi:MFS general substrate transporter [Aureobasidium pullulans]|uniref:MFS general substrate transporter n=1 Tax=Aureobasidium pullulans TaxID=5580 RepID=A0A4V6TFE1_AURPU|nr:MFS general substrate transporter [Aureobasidium pullulans]THY45003.1 MFS general substrate transporter [Aureobasidium pullulans]